MGIVDVLMRPTPDPDADWADRKWLHQGWCGMFHSALTGVSARTGYGADEVVCMAECIADAAWERANAAAQRVPMKAPKIPSV